MYSVRRSALRTAGSSLKAAVALPRQQVAPFAMRMGKPSSTVLQALPLVPARGFSQTVRVMEQDGERAAVDAALDSAQKDTTTSSSSDASFLQSGVYVSNMVFDANETHLQEAFSKFGDVVNIHIGRDSRGLSRGYAFVEFSDSEAAAKAIAEANNTFWHGRRINVQPRQQKKKTFVDQMNPPSKNIFVGNIPYETSDTDLNAIFRGLENVTDIRVAVDRNTGWPRGFAHCDFTDVESATKAVEKVSNMDLNGRRLRCTFAGPAKKRYPGMTGSGDFEPGPPGGNSSF